MRTTILLLAMIAVWPNGAIHGQTPRRIPVIAGNGLAQVLVETDGTVKTWGDPAAMDPNISIGDGVRPSDTREVKSPRPLAGGSDVTDAAVAITHALLLTRDGTVLAWGDNDSCELGTDKGSNAPCPSRG